MFHAASTGGMMGSCRSGGTHVSIPLFDPGTVLDVIEAEQITFTIMVPTMIGMMFAHDDYSPERLASLRQLAYGASPMPEAILDRIQSDLPTFELLQGYGMTECLGHAELPVARGPRGRQPALRSVGRPVMGVTISIRDATATTSSRARSARCGPVAATGWLSTGTKPEATAEAFADGWYHTGDAGSARRGRIPVPGRSGEGHDRQRRRERVLGRGRGRYQHHAAVAQVAVIGIPDDVWGEAVHAIVVCVAEVEVTADSILEHARESIAGYKVPKSVEFRTTPCRSQAR